MKLTIDSNILKKYNLTEEEYLILYLSAKNVDITQTMQSLVERGLADWNLFQDAQLVLSDNTKELLSSVIIDSDSKIQSQDDFYLELAAKLQEVYPKGKKPGTTYMWRGTKAEVAKKLKTLVVKYNFAFTEEQAIKATEEYVASFNGEYTKMRLLKYFILKADRDADGNTVILSEFMSNIENEGQEDSVPIDWVDRVV